MTDAPESPETALCFNCGAPVSNRRGRKFCPPEDGQNCQREFNNRMAAEGKLLAPLVKAMMATRGGGNTPTLPICGKARSEVTRICKLLNDADKAAGRPPAHTYVERMLADGTLYMDRCKHPERLAALSGPVIAVDPGSSIILESKASERPPAPTEPGDLALWRSAPVWCA